MAAGMWDELGVETASDVDDMAPELALEASGWLYAGLVTAEDA